MGRYVQCSVAQMPNALTPEGILSPHPSPLEQSTLTCNIYSESKSRRDTGARWSRMHHLGALWFIPLFKKDTTTKRAPKESGMVKEWRSPGALSVGWPHEQFHEYHTFSFSIFPRAGPKQGGTQKFRKARKRCPDALPYTLSTFTIPVVCYFLYFHFFGKD